MHEATEPEENLWPTIRQHIAYERKLRFDSLTLPIFPGAYATLCASLDADAQSFPATDFPLC